MVLKIDLLPPGVKRARTNKKLIAVIVVLLIAAVLGVGSWATKLKSSLADLNSEYDVVKSQADEVRGIEGETSSIRGRLQPISDKVAFIAQADECGYPYWERFYQIAEYIYGGAELRFFGIVAHAANGLVGNGTPEALYHQAGPIGGTDCAFGVTVKNANEFARFILNIIRCPEVSSLKMTGDVPSGRTIAAAWPRILRDWNLPSVGGIPTLDVEGLDFGGGGGGGMGGGMGGMPGEMGGGMPGGPEMGGAMPGGGEMGGMPGGAAMGGMGGGRGGGGSGAATEAIQPRLDGSIEMLVTCELNEPIMVPSPPGAGGGGGGGAGGAMGGGMGAGMPGMGGGMGGMPGEMGGGGPPGGPPGGMSGGGGPPGEPPAGDSGGGDDGGGMDEE